MIHEAVEAFHTALDRHVDSDMHGRDGDWVDGSVEVVVEALLMDGWQFPGVRVVRQSHQAEPEHPSVLGAPSEVGDQGSG